MRRAALVVACICLFVACREQRGEQLSAVFSTEDDADTLAPGYDLDDIQEAGELICITLSGPDTYFEFRGKAFGLQYDLAEAYARHIGAKLRMEVAHDTTELLARLLSHEADMAVLDMPPTPHTLRCANHWLVAEGSSRLAASVGQWYSPALLRQVGHQAASHTTVRRTPRPAMLNSQTGQISHFDALFQHHATALGWDWRLLAAQCYQESAFDPRALSWAGAQGLMQIMPATARHLGVEGDIYNPATNIEAAVRYLRELNQTFADIPGQASRIPYVLAAYNGGANHVRDAMALARKHGRNDAIWRDVEPYILHLSEPRYYRDAVVTSGYLRGQETYAYVRSIMDRWAQYRGQARSYSKGATPMPAKHPRTPTQIRRPDSTLIAP